MVAYESIELRPVGVVRSSLRERVDAPRQGAISEASAEIVLDGTSHAEDLLSGLETFSHVWVLYVFHLNGPSDKPKVQPPRSDVKRGVFATRSPHRPNPIGMSLCELVQIAGNVVRVRGTDMLDGTPVLDLKPYLPYADHREGASSGWLGEAPPALAEVRLEPRVREACAFFAERTGVDVEQAVLTILAAGTRPHAYRRIRREADGRSVLAWKSLRFAFETDGQVIKVTEVRSGFRPRELHGDAQGGDGVDSLALHRAWFSRC